MGALAMIGSAAQDFGPLLITSTVPSKWFGLISLITWNSYSHPFILTSAVSASLPMGRKLHSEYTGRGFSHSDAAAALPSNSALRHSNVPESTRNLCVLVFFAFTVTG